MRLAALCAVVTGLVLAPMLLTGLSEAWWLAFFAANAVVSGLVLVLLRGQR